MNNTIEKSKSVLASIESVASKRLLLWVAFSYIVTEQILPKSTSELISSIAIAGWALVTSCLILGYSYEDATEIGRTKPV